MLIFVDLLTYYSFKNNSGKKFFLNQIHWYWKLNCFNISEDVIYREGFFKQFLNSDDSAAFSSFYISRFWTYLTQDLDRCGHLLLANPLIFLFLCASLKMKWFTLCTFLFLKTIWNLVFPSSGEDTRLCLSRMQLKGLDGGSHFWPH